jgi:hypothetical protein
VTGKQRQVVARDHRVTPPPGSTFDEFDALLIPGGYSPGSPAHIDEDRGLRVVQ